MLPLGLYLSSVSQDGLQLDGHSIFCTQHIEEWANVDALPIIRQLSSVAASGPPLRPLYLNSTTGFVKSHDVGFCDSGAQSNPIISLDTRSHGTPCLLAKTWTALSNVCSTIGSSNLSTI